MGDFTLQLDHNLTADERGNGGLWSLASQEQNTSIGRHEHAEVKQNATRLVQKQKAPQWTPKVLRAQHRSRFGSPRARTGFTVEVYGEVVGREGALQEQQTHTLNGGHANTRIHLHVRTTAIKQAIRTRFHSPFLTMHPPELSSHSGTSTNPPSSVPLACR